MKIQGMANTIESTILTKASGASMVRWTTLVPCLGSNECDSKLYINFEFCENS
jgi:hypothetical protein